MGESGFMTTVLNLSERLGSQKQFDFQRIIRAAQTRIVFYISLSLSIYIIVQKEEVFKFLGSVVSSGVGLSLSLDVGLDVGSAYW